MTTFAQLFPQGPRSEAASSAFDDHHTVRRLTEMIGDPRDEFDMTRPRSSAERLSKVVEEALVDAAPTVIQTPRSSAKKRRRRRFDPLTVIAASVAVVALAAAGTVVGVQTANASPADGAMQSLRADEAMIQNSEQSFTTSHDRLATTLTQGAADAAALRAAVDGARVTQDLRAEDATVAVLDAELADQLVAELDRHIAALQGVALPDAVNPYRRGDLDEDSLAEIGGAIEAAQEQIELLDEATMQLREQRIAVDALEAAHRTKLEGLAASFTDAATQVLEVNEDAEPEFRDAVTAAAAGVVTSGLGGTAGVAALTAYRDAVIALIADELRADRELAEAAQRRQQQQQQSPSQPQRSEEPVPAPTEEPAPPGESTDSGGVIPPIDPSNP